MSWTVLEHNTQNYKKAPYSFNNLFIYSIDLFTLSKIRERSKVAHKLTKYSLQI